MTEKHFAAAFRGLPRPDDAPEEPYRIMCVVYAAFRAGRLDASTGTILRGFIARWDTLTGSEQQSLRTFAEAFGGEQAE